MDQLSFSEAEYTHKKRKTRREKFLQKMDKPDSLEAIEETDRSLLPQVRQWPQSLSTPGDVAGSLHAIVLQPLCRTAPDRSNPG